MSSIGRLRWQCRRGTLELDLLLQRYLDMCFENASFEERASFMRLVKLEDGELLHYLLEGRTPDAKDLTEIVQKIRILKSIEH